MERELVLPRTFQDYAWEVEAKGVFWDALVRVGENSVAVTFYDPARLSQDLTEELDGRPSVELLRVLVVSSVTEERMRDAVDRAPLEFFV
jgi:hypothetical protein